MRRTSLTQYDIIPEDMRSYLKHYGPHFNRKLFEFATRHMTKTIKGEETPIVPYSKELVMSMLGVNGIKLKHDQLYDSTYVANMCKADFLGSSIMDDKHLVLYIKDVIDDDDGYDGIVFNRWYADMCYNGIPIDWEEML